VRVGLGDDWQDVAAGTLHACGVRAGALSCWGSDASGQLGLGRGWVQVSSRVW
jgi:hypothetical protein